MTKVAWRAWPVLALGLVAACHNDGGAGGGDPKDGTGSAALNAEKAIQQTGKALSFTLADNGTLKTTVGASGSSAGTVAGSMMSGAMPPAMLKAVVGPALAADMTGTAMPSMMTSQEKFDQIGAQVRQLMQERLFVDSNLESDQNGTATYLLKPDPTCRPLPSDSDPAGTVPAIDSHCQDQLTKVDVRITVTNDGDGSRFAILIGPSRLQLFAFIVHSDLLAIEIDLPMAKAASDYINTTLQTDAPTGTYDRLQGKLRLSLQVAGDQKVTAALAVLEAIDVAQTSGAEVTTAAANPLYAITGDGVSKTAELQAGVGATEIDGTWDPQGLGLANRDLKITMGGYYGKYTLDENAKQIVLGDVGIGETKVTVRGTTIFDMNLNADSMRRFSGTLTADSTAGTVHIDLTPKLDLSLAFDYMSIASDYASPPAAATLHDTYGFVLANGGSAVSIDTVKAVGTFSGGIKVDAGTLTISAASASAETVVVPAGKCLTSISPAPANSNPLLGALQVTDCP